MANSMASYQGTSPNGTADTMCKITVSSLPCTLRLTDVIPEAGDYTLQLWVKSEANASVSIQTEDTEDSVNTTVFWNKYIKKFTATQSGDIYLKFDKVGTYYLWHVKLEYGHGVSEWTSYGSDASLSEPIVLGIFNTDQTAVVINSSDSDIGFIYEIHCKGEVTNPAVYHSESNTHIKINGRFKLDDVITIDTRRGQKSITKNYRGSETNIINSLVNTSKWLQLQTGYNHLIQSADSGAENMESRIMYTNEYEGV